MEKTSIPIVRFVLLCVRTVSTFFVKYSVPIGIKKDNINFFFFFFFFSGAFFFPPIENNPVILE